MDFTNCEINNYKYYGGNNGGKICIKYNGEDYMLKFPGVIDKKTNMTYSNSTISEHISCKILKSIGVNVQDTILGTYIRNGKEKIVVACRDFTSSGTILKQFAEFKNSQIETSRNGYDTELSEVLDVIDNQNIYDKSELKEFFWDTFIVDSLIGNFDRHNGNWGFLINEKEKKIDIAPLYDCASCLYPNLDDEDIEKILNDKNELYDRVYVFPNSALKINDIKINYYKYICSLENKECNKALLRIFPRIDIEKIEEIIDNTLYISNIRKEFYKKIIRLRYENILTVSYLNLLNE